MPMYMMLIAVVADI